MRPAMLLALLLAGGASAQDVLPIAPPAGLDVAPDVRSEVQQALASRDYPRAEGILIREIEKSQSPARLLAFLGGVFFLDGKHLNSAVALAKAQKLGPLDDSNRFLLAMAFNALDRPDWARPELEELHHKNPGNPTYLYWLGRLDAEAQDFPEAEKKLRRVIALAPAHSKAWDALGVCLEGMGRNEDAAKTYQEAVRLNRLEKTASPWPPMNYGVLLLKQDQTGEAEPYLREAVRIAPGFAQGHYQLGLLLERQQQAAGAVASLEKAASLDAAYADPWWALARIHAAAERPAEAEKARAEFQARKKAAQAKKEAAGQAMPGR